MRSETNSFAEHLSPRERRMEEIVLEFLKAQDEGREPDRPRLLAQNPDLADELRAFFDDQCELDTLVPPALRRKPPAADLPGQIGDYALLEKLGEGGMGVVYKAWQISLQRDVALKMIRDADFCSGEAIERFRREAQTVATFDNANIVRVFEVSKPGEPPYFSMQFIEGGTLAALPPALKGNPRAAARIVVQVARAIEYAHQRGILHRDLKPANVLLDRAGNPCVVDFGLAERVQTDGAEATAKRGIAGTIPYMAPEQTYAESRLTTAVDVYGLGTILYELLTGRRPFGALDRNELIAQVRNEPPVAPRSLRGALPRDLESICLKCLRKAPEERYASAAELADDLERFLAGRPTEARPVVPPVRLLMWGKRRPAVAALTALTVVVAIFGAAMFYAQSRQTDAEREKAEGLLYGSRIDKAARYVSDGYPDLGEELLLECPDRFRDLEWNFLMRCTAGRVETLRGHRQEVQSVACVPHGRSLVSGDSRGDILIWDAANLRNPFPLVQGDGAAAWVSRVGFSGDGRLCFAALKNMNVKVWDVARRRLLHEFTGAGSPAVLNRDGKLLATAGRSKEITVWDVDTRVVLYRYQHEGSVNGLAFSADGQWLASSGYAAEYHVQIWDLRNPHRKPRRLRQSNNKVWTNDVAFHPLKNNVLAVVQGSTISLWDLDAGVERRLQRGELGRCNGIAFSDDGRYLVAAHITGVLTVWDVELHKTVFSARRSRKELLSSVAFVQEGNGREVVYTRGAEVLVERWQETGSQQTRTYDFAVPVPCLAFNPVTGELASASADVGVKSWNPADGAEVFRGPLAGRQFISLAFAPDGKSLAVTTTERAIYLLDARTGQTLATFSGHGDVVTAVAFDPQGKRLASTSADRTFKVWDLASRTVVLSRTLSEPLLSVAFHPDGDRLAVGGNDGLLQVWDLRTEQVLTFEGHEHNVGNVSFSPDGRLLASAGTDARVILWDAATGREVRRLSGHTGTVTAVAFSPNGQRLVSAGMDNALKIWNAHNGQLLLSLNGQAGVTGLAIREDGNVIASAHLDRAVRLWQGTPP